MIVPSRSGRSQRLRVMVRGLLLWTLGLAVASYFALTTARFFVLQQRTTNYVTWMDCILAPARWGEIERKRGDAYLAEGLNALEERKWREAILKIRAGLAITLMSKDRRKAPAAFDTAMGKCRVD